MQNIRRHSEETVGIETESVYDVMLIPLKFLSDIWYHAYPLIVKGQTANPELSMDDIMNGLVDQSIQLWIVVRKNRKKLLAVFLTSIEKDREDWVLSLYNLGGEAAKDWAMDCHRTMHDFAKSEGCQRVRMCGRPAWQRILPNYPIVGERGGHFIYERPTV